MTIGLTSEQLFSSFITSLTKRQDQLKAERMIAEIGLNPDMNKLLSELQEKYSNIFTADQFFAIIAVILAFMDSIVSNNKAMAKVLPHIEA